MANLQNFDWGTSRAEYSCGLEVIGSKNVYCKGTYTIKPFVVVPLTLHEKDGEVCIMKTAGMRAIVIDGTDKHFHNIIKTMEKLAEAPRLESGETVDCPKGSGIALYNPLPFPATVEFQRYYPE